ncbi:thiamine pyrophosphate-binding protein [Actinoplanes sp. TBRC 11911]|uniref:thiamine pyrophosphate-binding protein n=1 Tax=Actinoplanes sp. TBRC 11911 TaxID=2729386 RepID=UPI00145E6302|nr:thiamine pyrophosphate-binding protein [Actinoplanes sp. TBRC 11911]NMO55517.1 thiamine pyrophosphate-binding protein [Actinoplanes sp. TBRC 11911]
MKVHAALARALANHGTDTMFGLIGDANLFLAHSFADGGGQYVGAVHEAGAMFMAFGYAGRTGKLGVVTVTHGPALTNTLTGLVEAVRGRIPLLVIAGDTATTSRSSIQDIPQRDVVLPTGAGFEQARTPETALADLALAIRRAVVERRPVVFNVPVDFTWHDVDYWDVPLDLPAPQRLGPDREALLQAVLEIAAADRPVLLAGRGAIGARSSVLRLAERIGAPMATTLKAKDLFRGEPFDMEVAGAVAGPATREVFAAADLIISIGTSLNGYATENGRLLRGKKQVVIDIDEARATLRGDATAVTDRLIDLLDLMNVPRREFRTPEMAHRLTAQAAPGERPPTAPGTVDVVTALRRLDEILPRPRTVVSDAGRFMMESSRYVHPGDPRAYVLPVNFGSIGMGMGAAVGAAAARTGEPVILVCGDGGFMHAGTGEFSTAARYGLDIIVVVCNDGGYGAEHIQYTRRDLDPALSLFDWPDLAKLAGALGGDGITVRGPLDLEQAAKAVENRTSPLLIDLRLDVHHIQALPH